VKTRRSKIKAIRFLTIVVSENGTMELGQTTASWNRDLSQDTAAVGHGIESYQSLGGIGKPDL
jgi:hypothetical protein